MLGQRRKLAAASPELDEVLSLHPGLIIDDIHDSSDDDKISNELRKSGKEIEAELVLIYLSHHVYHRMTKDDSFFRKIRFES